MKKQKKLLSKRARNPLLGRVLASESSPLYTSMPSYSGVDRINMSASTIDTTLSNTLNNNNNQKMDKINANLNDKKFIKINDADKMVCKKTDSVHLLLLLDYITFQRHIIGVFSIASNI